MRLSSPSPGILHMAIISRVGRSVSILENVSICMLLGIICVVTVIQVLFRFVLQLPLAWTEELSTFSFVWLALLGSAVAVREKAHIGVEAVMELFPPNHRVLIVLSNLLIIQAFLLCLIIFGVQLLIGIGDQRSGGLGIQMFWVYLSLPVNALLMFCHTIPEMKRLLNELRGILS